VASGRAEVPTVYGPGKRVEQDPATWWGSLAAACAQVRDTAPAAYGAVRALGFSAARQTFVPVAPDGTPVGAALVWSDRRADDEVAGLAASLASSSSDGAGRARRRTGMVLDAAAVAAKIAWLAGHEPDRLRAARWLLAPRDLVAWRLTGEVATDRTLASATGLYDTAADPDGGRLLAALVGGHAELLPPVRPSTTVLGAVLDAAADELGLPRGVVVVLGAGDRACEVLGAGASPAVPMVSWGTTANVSVPVAGGPSPADPEGSSPPTAVVVTRGALGGWLLEGGLSAAGSALDWLGRLTGIDPATLAERASARAPGADGAVVLPWFGGARAPWWRDGAGGAMVHLSLGHDAFDLARALIESVAFDVARCLESVARSTSTPHEALALGGGGSALGLWVEVLGAVTGLPTRRRRSGEAASAGAALLVRRALGEPTDVDGLDPVVEERRPDPDAVACYRALRPTVEATAAAVIGLARARETEPS